MRSLVVFVLLLIGGIGWCQPLHQFHHLTPEDGLTSGQYNYYIHQDVRGYVWISSTAGLNRFDGKRVLNYQREAGNPRSLLSKLSAQSRISERVNGDLFFTASVGFSRYNRRTDDFDHFRLVTSAGDTLRDNYLWCYLSPDERHLWVSGGDRLFYVDPDHPENSTLIDERPAHLKDRMLALGADRFLLINFSEERPGGLATTYDLSTGEHEDTAFDVPGKRLINDVIILGEDSLLVATDKGLWTYSRYEDSWHRHSGTEKLAIMEVEFFGKGDYYLGTRSGMIFRYRASEKEADVLLDNGGGEVDTFRTDLERMYIAPDSTLWVGTRSSGVYYTSLQSKAFRLWRSVAKGRSSDVIGLAEGKDNELYVLYRDYIGIHGGGTPYYLDLPVDGAGYQEPTGIYADTKGRVWVSSYSGLYYLEHGERELHEYTLWINNERRYDAGYFKLFELPDDRLVFSLSYGYSYIREHDGTLTPWLQKITRVRGGEFDDVGKGVIVSFEDSLHLVRTVGHTTAIDTSIVGLGLVNGVDYDSVRNCFWVGTYSGLQKIYYNDVWHVKPVSTQRVGSATITSLTMGPAGKVWFTTTGGVYRYDPNSGQSLRYGLSDGGQARDFNLGVALLTTKGDLLLGGPQGINEWTGFTKEGSLRELAISQIVANGNAEVYKNYVVGGLPADEVTDLQLPFDLRDLEIGVATFDYRAADGGALSYVMTGGDWAGKERPVRANGVVDLFNLNPGYYELALGGYDGNERELSAARVLSITIRPPWYQTWWAYTLAGLIILAIIGAFVWIQYRKVQAELEAAELGQKVAETETSVLRLQMNPHFIFNSLNSIDDYIMVEEDVLRAHDYLVVFAELMRKILDMSEQPLTRLDQEVAMLRGYVDAERMRVGEQLRFRVEQDEEVDMIFTWLPTMILQPFVENAIWHGIGDRPEGGTVTLRFELNEEEDLLKVEVEDDGRGRGNAEKGTKEHTSKALNITRKRMELLNAKTSLAHQQSTAPVAAPPKAHFEIEDLKHPNGTAAGTRVVLYLPLIYPENDTSSSN